MLWRSTCKFLRNHSATSTHDHPLRLVPCPVTSLPTNSTIVLTVCWFVKKKHHEKNTLDSPNIRDQGDLMSLVLFMPRPLMFSLWVCCFAHNSHCSREWLTSGLLDVPWTPGSTKFATGQSNRPLREEEENLKYVRWKWLVLRWETPTQTRGVE